MTDFISDYFVKPILEYQGYNIVNTLVYGLILLGISFYLIFPFFDKKGIKFDFNFFKAVFPFIVFGSSLRIVEDLKLFIRSANPLDLGFYFISPGIYIMVGLLTITALLLSIYLSKKINKPVLQIFMGIGIVLALPTLGFIMLQGKQFFGLGIILISLIIAFGIAFFLFGKGILKDNLAKVALIGQLFDGSATFVAVQFFKFGEQHVLPSLIMNTFGAIAFLILKLIIGMLIIFALNKYMNEKHEENLRNFILVFIAILGFAPGIRDTLMIFTLGA